MHERKTTQSKSYKPNFLKAKKALILNFTGSSYHWGCYGTSMEIYQSLLEHDYYIEVVPVEHTHSITPSVGKITDFDDESFFKNFYQKNPNLMRSLSQNNIVIINGEGTLHRLGKGALNLLYLAYISKKYFKKRVHLINFSCFPNGDASNPREITQIYPGILRYLDLVSPREHITSQILANSGIKTKQSFDCLPRFLDRYNYTNSHKPKGNILVTGGVNFDENRYKLLVKFIDHFLTKSCSVTFLTGAHFSPAQEDLKLQKLLKENPDLLGLKFVQAQSMEQWINEFKNSSFLFSARFHHSIAALSIGTPFKYLSANTPKISAALETLDENSEDYCVKENEEKAIIDAAEEALIKQTSISSERRVNKMLELANNNFIDL